MRRVKEVLEAYKKDGSLTITTLEAIALLQEQQSYIEQLEENLRTLARSPFDDMMKQLRGEHNESV